jgi:hypothetical protein
MPAGSWSVITTFVNVAWSPALRTVTAYGTKSPTAATSSVVLLEMNSALPVGSSGMSTAGAICPATVSSQPYDAGSSVYGAPGNVCKRASVAVEGAL